MPNVKYIICQNILKQKMYIAGSLLDIDEEVLTAS